MTSKLHKPTLIECLIVASILWLAMAIHTCNSNPAPAFEDTKYQPIDER